MLVYLSLVICIVGALIYAFMSGKAEALGKDMFWVGLLVFLLKFGSMVLGK